MKINYLKTILLLGIFTICNHQANSQVLISLLFGDKLNSDKIEFGLDGGINLATMSNFESSSVLPSFNLGFYFDILLKDQWYLNTGVLVKSSVGLNKLSEQDAALLDPQTIFLESGDYSQKINYFHIPVTVKYRFANHFYANLGPQMQPGRYPVNGKPIPTVSSKLNTITYFQYLGKKPINPDSIFHTRRD